MHEAASRFVDHMGLQLEAEGLARSAGRIFAYLMLSEGASSLDELAETLRVSKAAVSTNARLLEQAGMLERTCEPGDRRDFYQLRPDAWDRLLLGARTRWAERQVLLGCTARSLPRGMEDASRRLREAERFHGLFVEELGTLIERWRAVGGGDDGGSAAVARDAGSKGG
jgi:hypothetical protein